jgi:F-type H+-transporting ATPase subunit alpha
MPVEHQIAIIYCGTKGLLQKVPVKSVVDFQEQFIHHMEEYQKSTLEALRKGQLTDEIIAVLEKVARDMAAKYEK